MERKGEKLEEKQPNDSPYIEVLCIRISNPKKYSPPSSPLAQHSAASSLPKTESFKAKESQSQAKIQEKTELVQASTPLGFFKVNPKLIPIFGSIF